MIVYARARLQAKAAITSTLSDVDVSTYSARVVAFMRAIAAVYSRLTHLPSDLFFNSDDADVIHAYADYARPIWEDVVANVSELDFCKRTYCPLTLIHTFCTTWNGACMKCGYGDRHGCCDSIGSDFYALASVLVYGKYKIPIHEVLNVKLVMFIIDSIQAKVSDTCSVVYDRAFEVPCLLDRKTLQEIDKKAALSLHTL